MSLLRWFNRRSSPNSNESHSAGDRSGESGSHAPGAFRLEPLEPRVLLSGDSVAGLVVHQVLLQQDAHDAAADPSAIAQQSEAAENTQDISGIHPASDGTSSTASKVNVAWADGWQTSGSSGNAAADSSMAPVEDPANSTADATQLALAAAAEIFALTPQEAVSGGYSALVGGQQDAIVASVESLTKLPRGPPESAQATAAASPADTSA
jgi:hypothetical protein